MKGKIWVWCVFIILIGGIGIVPFLPSVAQSAAICAGQPVPSGHVCVSAYHSSQCPGTGFNTFTTQPVTTADSGMNVCSGCAIPSCYVITSMFHSGSCMRPETTELNAYAIKIPASGSTICSSSPMPSGYTTISSFHSGYCANPVSTSHNAYYINCTAPNINLSIVKSGTGSGKVSSSPLGIDCGSTCTKAFCCSNIVLTATPDQGHTFAGWSGGGCSGMGSTCTVTLKTNTTVTAAFTAPFKLSVVKSGTGTGSVNSAPSGIYCGSTCESTFSSGSNVTLYSTAASGSAFSGWSGGGCSGVGPCTVRMDAHKSVTATFTRMYALSIGKAGTGSGKVSSSPLGIDCGLDCRESYPSGTSVTLSATRSLNSAFSGWSGGCSGGGPCIVVMNSDKSVTATFTELAMQAVPGANIPSLRPTLTVEKSGQGTVISDPPPPAGSIECGSQCSATYMRGSEVQLAAKPWPSYRFVNWTGCTSTYVDTVTGQLKCKVIINANTRVTATFGPLKTP